MIKQFLLITEKPLHWTIQTLHCSVRCYSMLNKFEFFSKANKEYISCHTKTTIANLSMCTLSWDAEIVLSPGKTGDTFANKPSK